MLQELAKEIDEHLSDSGRKTFQNILDVYYVSPEEFTSLKAELVEIEKANKVSYVGEKCIINASMQACELIHIILDGFRAQYEMDGGILREQNSNTTPAKA